MLGISEDNLNLLICPDCKQKLEKIAFQEKIIGLCCPKCEVIHPVKEDILIILAKGARNYNLEYPLIKEIEEKLSKSSFPYFGFIRKTLDLILSKKGASSWEWEDEQFWSREYKRENMNTITKNWNDRIWQRESLVKELISRMKLRGITLLDVGCGEGQNFRLLLSKYCDHNSLYIGVDISFTALKLNRSRNEHENSLYVLSSADHNLPFKDGSIDVLCYFGILHHTKKKIDNVSKDERVLRKNGYIILAESIDRPTLFQTFLMAKAETSAHEDHISKRKLLSQLDKKGSDILFYKEEATPFYTGTMTLFHKALLYNKKLFLLTMNFDTLITKTLGKISPFFRAGEILLLARRATEKAPLP